MIKFYFRFNKQFAKSYNFSIQNQIFNQKNHTIKLIELNNLFQNEKNDNKKLALFLQMMELRNQQYNKENHQESLRDKLILAKLNYETKKINECISLLSDIFKDNYEKFLIENEDENKGFLATLFLLNSLIQPYSKDSEKQSQQATQLYQYFINKYCPLYQQYISGQQINNSLSLTPELWYLKGYVESLLIYANVLFQRGNIQNTIKILTNSSQINENVINLLSKLNQDQIKSNFQISTQDIYQYSTQMLQIKPLNFNSMNQIESLTFDFILLRAKINLELGKSNLQQHSFEDSANFIFQSLKDYENLISKNQIKQESVEYIEALILLYEYTYFALFDEQELKLIENKIIKLIEKIQDLNIKQEMISSYNLLRVKYIEDDIEEIEKLVPKIEKQNQLELNEALIKKTLSNNDSQRALKYTIDQIHLIIDKFDPNHYLFEQTLTNYLAINRNLTAQKLPDQIIQNLQTKFDIQQYPILVKFLEFEIKVNQVLNQLNQKINIENLPQAIQTLETFKFPSGSKYHRYAVFMILGLKKGLREITN